MPGIDQLERPVGPWLLSPTDPSGFAALVTELSRRGLDVRRLAGSRTRSIAEMFDAFSETFEFPDYFGRNWAALDECMADLSWLHADAFALVVGDAEQLLIDDDDQLPTLLGLLNRVAAEWAEPVASGEAWDRPAVPFHVVLIGAGPRVHAAAIAIGAKIDDLEA
jgi:hypothetical protein